MPDLTQLTHIGAIVLHRTYCLFGRITRKVLRIAMEEQPLVRSAGPQDLKTLVKFNHDMARVGDGMPDITAPVCT